MAPSLDWIGRQWTMTQVSFQGTCPDMCPEKERYVRVIQKRVHPLECSPSGRIAPELAVKEYSRSAADQVVTIYKCYSAVFLSIPKIIDIDMTRSIMRKISVGVRNRLWAQPNHIFSYYNNLEISALYWLNPGLCAFSHNVGWFGTKLFSLIAAFEFISLLLGYLHGLSSRTVRTAALTAGWVIWLFCILR